MQELKEACAVFGLYNAGNVNGGDMAYLALYSMQHRGQDGAGLAGSDGRKIILHKALGLVSEVFNAENLKPFKKKRFLCGHVRYATSSEASVINTQPIVMFGKRGQIALAHNGNLVNTAALQKKLHASGALLQTEVDSEIMLHLIARSPQKKLEDKIQGMMEQVLGSYALTVMGNGKIMGVRDPWGMRPLAIGKKGGSYMLASETCAFSACGFEFVRDVRPGEIVIIDGDGLSSIQTKTKRRALCSFEYVYFARPNSCMDGVDIFEARQRMGALLAQTAPVEADIVAGVPDSAIPAALGYAKASGIPYAQVFIRSPYAGRSFIQPGQGARERTVRMKLTVLPSQVEGKRIVLVDDSIVRGTNSLILIRMLRAAGAKEVHMRVASPPVRFPCHFGINTPTRDRLIGAHSSIEELRGKIEADSLAYLPLEGLQASADPDCRGLCTACFSGEYPMPLTGMKKEVEY